MLENQNLTIWTPQMQICGLISPGKELFFPIACYSVDSPPLISYIQSLAPPAHHGTCLCSVGRSSKLWSVSRGAALCLHLWCVLLRGLLGDSLTPIFLPRDSFIYTLWKTGRPAHWRHPKAPRLFRQFPRRIFSLGQNLLAGGVMMAARRKNHARVCCASKDKGGTVLQEMIRENVRPSWYQRSGYGGSWKTRATQRSLSHLEALMGTWVKEEVGKRGNKRTQHPWKYSNRGTSFRINTWARQQRHAAMKNEEQFLQLCSLVLWKYNKDVQITLSRSCQERRSKCFLQSLCVIIFLVIYKNNKNARLWLQGLLVFLCVFWQRCTLLTPDYAADGTL